MYYVHHELEHRSGWREIMGMQMHEDAHLGQKEKILHAKLIAVVAKPTIWISLQILISHSTALALPTAGFLNIAKHIVNMKKINISFFSSHHLEIPCEITGKTGFNLGR